LDNTLKEILENPQFVEGVAWTRRTVKANEVLVKQGDIGKTLFVVESGILRVTGHVELGEHKNIQPGFCDLETGSVFGETCLHASSVRMATVLAATDSVVVEINGARLSIFLDAHPILGYLFYKQVFQSFVTRLDIANQRVEHLMAWGLKVHDIDRYLQ